MKSYPLLLLVLLPVFIMSSCTISVDRGPFEIQPDQDREQSKSAFLYEVERQSISESVPRKDRPNILLILVDDLGKHDITAYDPAGVDTPHINSIANDGVLFTEAYSTSSVCSPSRAGLFTGRYQQRYGFERQPMNRYARNRMEYWIVDHFVNTEPMRLTGTMARVPLKNIDDQGIPVSEILLPELLQAAGYRTGLFGKWHLGHTEPFKPNLRGFDEHYGFYEAFTLYAPLGASGIMEYRHDYFANRHIWNQEREGTCAIRLNDSVIIENEYLTFSIADKAGEYIRSVCSEPFFLTASFSAPHTPFQVPASYYEKFSHIQDPNKRVYFGMIAALDDAVGELLEVLVQQGIEENTMVIFVSDNGGATYTGATDNGPLKAGKFSQFEGGVNVPMILKWPGKTGEGAIYRKPVSLLDIFATVTAATGVSQPHDRIIDGVNLLKYLDNVLIMDSIPHQALFWRTDYNKAVRTPDWKLIWNERDEQVFLYRIGSDKGEKSNVAKKYPRIVRELKEAYDGWEQGMKPPMWPGLMEFRFDIEGETTWWAI